MDKTVLEEKYTELRKNQINLIVDAEAVFAFGIWNIVCVYLSFFLGKGWSYEATRQAVEETGIPAFGITIIMILILFILAFITCIPNFIISASAIREGQGKKRGNLYLVLTGFLLLAEISNTIYVLVYYVQDYGIPATIASIVFEMGALYCCVNLIISGIKVKKLSAELNQKGAA